MAPTNDDIITRTLNYEGGWVDRPDDRGGPTNFGWTIPTLSDWLGRPATRDDVQNLTTDTARRAYDEYFMQRFKIGSITDDRLRAVVFDAAVNHGPRRAIQLLQRTIGVAQDGVIGDRTLAQINQLSNTSQGRLLPFRFLRQRTQAYVDLVRADSSQSTFLGGWMARVSDQYESLA